MSTAKWARFLSVFNINKPWHQYFNRTVHLSNHLRHFCKYSPHRCFFKNAVYLLFFPPLKLISNNDDVSSEITLNDVEENLSHLLTLARIALEKGDTEKAEAIIQMGLKISEEHGLLIAVPFMYDILITIAFAANNLEKAENLLVDVVEKMAQIGTPENDHYIVDFKLRLARIYSANKNNELAEIGFKTCLETQKQKLLDGDTTMRTGMLYVNVLFWYGVHKYKNGRHKEAKEMLDVAYDYSTQIKGLTPYQEMVILTTLSDLNMELGEYDSALQLMKNAIMLGKGISSVDLPKSYVKLARIYVKMGSTDLAKQSALEGQKLAGLFYNASLMMEAKILLDEIDKMP